MKSKLEADLKQAQLSRDEVKTSVLRMLLSELKYAEISKSQELSNQDVISVIQKELKKRRESIDSYRKGNREDLAQKEELEAKILEAYLPKQLSDEELTKAVEETITELEAEKGLINELGATSAADMGRVIGAVKSKVGDQAEGSRIASIVKEKLGT